MKCLSLTIVCGILAFLSTSCTTNQNDDLTLEKPTTSSAAIQNIGVQTLSFDINYEIPKGYRIAFEVYGENPLETSNGTVTKRSDITPILTGITNGEGKYNLSRVVSEQVKDIYVYSSFIGVPTLLHGQISNGSVKPVAIDLGEMAPATETAETRATSYYPYQTIGTWNYLGKPNYIFQKESISYSLLSAINQVLPEWSAVSPYAYKQADIHVNQDAEIRVSMIHSGGIFNDVLGYFTYEGNIKDVDPSSIHEMIAFPRAKVIPLLPSGLKAGEMVQLKYYNPQTKQLQNTFPKGVSIGWVLRTNGYGLLTRSINDGLNRFYSNPAWNPEKTNKNHTVLFKKDNFVAIGFEDMPNEWVNGWIGDKDCNDVLFHVSSYPESAISYDADKLPDNSNDIENTDESDVIQPLSDIINVPEGYDFMKDMLVASKSTLKRVSSPTDLLSSYGNIVGAKDVLYIANSSAMSDLLSNESTTVYRTFVKTIIRKAETKAEEAKKKFVKTTVRGMTVYIDGTEYDGPETKAGESLESDNVEIILRQIILSLKDKLLANQAVCIVIDMEFDPVSEDEFIDVLPIGPYTPFIGPGNGE
jgi:hypothetical protein